MLIIAATPIGNYLDASSRLTDALKKSDIIAAEDTRTVLQLSKRLGVRIEGKLVSLHDHNENDRVDELVNASKSGDTILLVSDAGMPLINDPGFKVAKKMEDAGEKVTCLPGPSAPMTALVLSGLPTHKFSFEGFLPPKSVGRRNALEKLVNFDRTMIFLESTHRITKTLVEMCNVFGKERKACVARELTKSHEEILRGTLLELSQIAQKRQLKGEMCICVAGKDNCD